MNCPSTNIVFRIFICILIHISLFCSLHAQDSDRTTLGISFSSDIAYQEILDALPELEKLGINVIELAHPTSEELIEQISTYTFDIYVRHNVQFLTQSEMNNQQIFEEKILVFVNRYITNKHIDRLCLVSYSSFLENNIYDLVSRYIPASNSIIFYDVNTSTSSGSVTITNARNSSNTNNSTHFLFDAPFHKSDIQILKTIYERGSELILFDFKWFTQALQTELYFQKSLLTFAESDHKLLLLPQIDSERITSFPNWPIIIFVLLWISFGIHIKSSQNYASSISRYFSFHRFFVNDVMHCRERALSSGIILTIQHAFFTGLIVYLLVVTFISQKGLEAFYFHLPEIGIFGNTYFSLFITVVLITLLITYLGQLWLYIPSTSFKHFSQVLNLYSWVFHIDFLIVSVSLILAINKSSPILIIVLSYLHLIIWTMGFIATAYESSKYMMTSKIKYLLNTLGLFLLLAGLLISLFVLNDYLLEVLKLATSL